MAARMMQGRRIAATVVGTLLVVLLELALLQAVFHLAEPASAAAIHAGLLVVASIGCFLWFRRLIARHRSLERTIVEQSALAESEQRLLALVENGSDLVAVLDPDGTATYVSPSSSRLLGLRPEQVVGHYVTDLVDPEDRPLLVQLVAALGDGDGTAVSLRMTHVDGRTLVVEGALSNRLADSVVAGLVLTVRDVTERQAMQGRLLQQAFHDELTGLANRQLFGDRLAHALERRAGKGRLAVLLCDLDDFKTINDSLGHDFGDQVLAEVGRRVATAIRTGDTAARLGGDEFGVLMEDAGVESAQHVAARVLEALSEPVVVDGHSLPVGASVGIALALPGLTTREEVLRNADVAMYGAKERGKGTVTVYEPSQHARALDQLTLRSDLQRALRDDELVLHFQPTIDLEDERIVGFEALVRWEHPVRGLLSPAAFVPMAERTGLIAPLGRWVLREACRAGAGMQRPGRPLSMSVNIAPRQLEEDAFVDEVLAVLAETGLPAEQLVLEITESALLHHLDKVAPRLERLRANQVRIAIDDFGTGYSSLSYLTHLPVDVLKVDKAFVDHVTTTRQDASVTQAILAMGHSMDLCTIAEGVEERDQARWLSGARCALAQGYLWSRPVDLATAHQLLAARSFPPGRDARTSATAHRVPA